MNIKFISVLAIVLLASLACGFNINLPQMPTPGAEITKEINIPAPEGDEVNLKLSFGAGKMTLAPGAEQLLEGSAAYNYAAFKPVVLINENQVEIKMSEINSIPAFNDLKNEWDFKLGTTPMNLSIESGAYDGFFELGGLSLTNLTIKDGASNVELSFSEPNSVKMSTFRYDTGASNVKMSGLANANFSILDFSAGAGDYTLDFSGELQDDATVKINSGFSNLILVVPENINAVVTITSGASNISTGAGWSQNGDIYKQEGKGATLTFIVEIGAENITLTK